VRSLFVSPSRVRSVRSRSESSSSPCVSKRWNDLAYISRLARVAEDRKERMGGIKSLVDVLSSRDFDAPRKLREVFASVIGVAGELSVWKASCCCANAHSVVDVLETRGESPAEERCVLKAGGGPVAVSIPLLLCDAGARLDRLSCSRGTKAGAD
jgi:hypothetical protein